LQRNNFAVKLFLDTGKVEADLRDALGWTPLLWAAEGGHEDIVKLLLDTGKVNADSNDRSALTSLGRDAFVRLLNRSELVADLKDNGLTPLSSAVKHG
jgi:ankyrin repeat protein